MPRFDGTGPQGAGPMTGRGEGYCAIRLPDEPGNPADGYAGLEGEAMQPGTARAVAARRAPFYRRWSWPVRRPGLRPRRGQGRGPRRGRRFAGR
ncbi:MAG: DUF5320 domain-containing protein [Anaerolineae bacterium]|jgi:hypothetical protein